MENTDKLKEIEDRIAKLQQAVHDINLIIIELQAKHYALGKTILKEKV